MQLNVFLLTFFLMIANATFVFAQEEFEATQRETYKYEDHGKRDPMWNLVTPSGVIKNYDTDYEMVDLNLEGTMSGANNNSIAIINGKVVEKGNKIGQYVVADIQHNMVILQEGDNMFELRLKKEE